MKSRCKLVKIIHCVVFEVNIPIHRIKCAFSDKQKIIAYSNEKLIFQAFQFYRYYKYYRNILLLHDNVAYGIEMAKECEFRSEIKTYTRCIILVICEIDFQKASIAHGQMFTVFIYD